MVPSELLKLKKWRKAYFYERLNKGFSLKSNDLLCHSCGSWKYFPVVLQSGWHPRVGSTLGEAALAAVGATTSISTLFIGFLSGLTNGFALLIARQFGAGDKKGVTRYGAGCLLLGCITSVLLTFICVSSLPFILRLLNVPEALMGQSTAYIRAVLLGLLATMLYNGCASILRLWAIPLRPFYSFCLQQH